MLEVNVFQHNMTTKNSSCLDAQGRASNSSLALWHPSINN